MFASIWTTSRTHRSLSQTLVFQSADFRSARQSLDVHMFEGLLSLKLKKISSPKFGHTNFVVSWVKCFDKKPSRVTRVHWKHFVTAYRGDSSNLICRGQHSSGVGKVRGAMIDTQRSGTSSFCLEDSIWFLRFGVILKLDGLKSDFFFGGGEDLKIFGLKHFGKERFLIKWFEYVWMQLFAAVSCSCCSTNPCMNCWQSIWHLFRKPATVACSFHESSAVLEPSLLSNKTIKAFEDMQATVCIVDRAFGDFLVASLPLGWFSSF